MAASEKCCEMPGDEANTCAYTIYITIVSIKV